MVVDAVVVGAVVVCAVVGADVGADVVHVPEVQTPLQQLRPEAQRPL